MENSPANFLRYLDSELRQNLKVPGILKTNRDLKDMRERKQPYSDLIDYVYELLEKHSPRHSRLLEPDILEEKKSDGKAEEFRRQGNALYILKTRNVDAIEAYNKSICYAVSRENLSIGLANRSAVFFMMNMYPECVESIRLAREAGVPERLKEKLDRREAQCQEKMKTLKLVAEKIFVPEIGLPVNKKIPFLAKCLLNGSNSSNSRKMVTEEDIPAGTVIALEEPMCKVMVNKDIYLRCANCLAEVPHRLYPCSTCTNTMFCSKICEKKAFENFHAIECPISGSLMKIFEDKERLALRFVIFAFVAFKGDTEKMDAALAKMDRKKDNVFSFNWSQEISPEDLYAPIHTLLINEYEPESILLRMYILSCLLLSLLQRHSPIFIERFLTSPKAIKLLKNLIMHHMLIVNWNSCSLDSTQDAIAHEVPMKFGFAITHSSSHLKFSCIPNVVPFTFKTYIGLITLKKITAGQELYCNSHYHHFIKPKDVRQKEIFEKYNIICKCLACVENYPMLADAEYPCDVEELALEENLLAQYSFDYCKIGFTMSTEYIRKYGHLYPIQQLGYAEQTLMFCLMSLCGNTPLRIKEKVRLSTTQRNN